MRRNETGLQIGIVGAGPAGMMAALQAVRTGGRVVLFDANRTVGRKLAVTGNGRCNITNSRIDPDRYAGAEAGFVQQVLAGFGHAELVAFLEGIAVPLHVMADGWCYPRSGSAAAVVAAFAAALEQAGVELHLGETVRSFFPAMSGWGLSAQEEYRFDRLIVASGGLAQPKLGARGELFAQLERLGHTVIAARPGLAPIVADMRRLHKMQGVRMDVGLQLWRGKSLLGQSWGNAIFTQWGLNGPAAMDLSHLVSGEKGELELAVNFIAGAEPLMQELLQRFADSEWPVGIVLSGLLPPKAAHFVVQSCGVAAEVGMRRLGEREKAALWSALCNTRLQVRGTRGFEFAQVSAGGIPADEVVSRTMASRKQAGLFLAGEVLDVIGPCGGYNLQFAFSTGALAGIAAAS